LLELLGDATNPGTRYPGRKPGSPANH